MKLFAILATAVLAKSFKNGNYNLGGDNTDIDSGSSGYNGNSGDNGNSGNDGNSEDSGKNSCVTCVGTSRADCEAWVQIMKYKNE